MKYPNNDRHVRLKQKLGQHLLIDRNIARKIVSALYWEWSPLILEIGPGSGALTGLLLEKAERVTAVEIDHRFVEVLEKNIKENSRFRLVHGNILKQDWNDLTREGNRWQVVGNLPYQITSPLLFQILDYHTRLMAATLMVQKEVADRIAAPAGSRKRGILSVLCQYHAEVHKLFNVSRNCFKPPPKVDSAIIQLIFYQKFPVRTKNEKLFQQVVKIAFGQRRKKMSNSLAEFKKVQIPEIKNLHKLDRRPEQLTVAEFAALTNDLIDYHDS